MSKVDDNKKQKKQALYRAAFELFTEKGFSKTAISDITERSGLAKGTFYLYFKDKYELRDDLVAYKASQLLDNAYETLEKAQSDSFEQEMLLLTDYIIARFKDEPTLLRFISKNLSWGIFKNAFTTAEYPSSRQFSGHYLLALDRHGINCPSPELMLFTLVELIGATCHSCILYKQPVDMDTYLPYLHQALKGILHAFTTPN